MTEPVRILESILDLQHFAKENSFHGLIDGLNVALETYVNEASLDENERIVALRALKATA